MTGHDQTSANLAAAGGKSIPDYLKNAFPNSNVSEAAAVASPTPNAGSARRPSLYEALSGKPAQKQSDFTPSPPSEEGDVGETPFYIKVKGKGKGRPVMFDRSKSSVAQVHGEFDSCPLDGICVVNELHTDTVWVSGRQNGQHR